MTAGNSADPASHKDFAESSNRRVWELLQKPVRTPAESEEMLYAAYASAYHWLKSGTGLNRQRAEWLIARVHAELGFGEGALRHAARCRELTDEFPDLVQDFDVAYAMEAVARANAAAGRDEEARQFRAKARRAGESIANPADRAIFEEDLKDGNWHGLFQG